VTPSVAKPVPVTPTPPDAEIAGVAPNQPSFAGEGSVPSEAKFSATIVDAGIATEFVNDTVMIGEAPATTVDATEVTADTMPPIGNATADVAGVEVCDVVTVAV
jgi:hypothetical protein